MSAITPVTSYPAAGVTSGSLVASTGKLRVNLLHAGTTGNVVVKLIRYGSDTAWYATEYEWPMSPGDRIEQNIDVYGGSDRYHILMEGGQTPSGFTAYLASLTTPGSVAGAPELHAADHKASGADDLLSAPGAIGGGTPNTGAFTTLTARNGVLTPSATTSGVQSALTITGSADTGQTASTEKYDVRVNGARIVTWATGALTTQRSVLIEAPTLAFAGASTVTKCATFAIDRAPQAGTNATLTNAYALWIQAGLTQLDGNLAMGAGTTITPDSGTGSCSSNAVTISKSAGVVTTESLTTAGGAKQTITVTNTLVTASSRIHVTLNGGTNTTRPVMIGQVVPGSGSFTVDIENLTAATALNGTIKFAFNVL